ncbi:hypothetical protein [Telluribacter sp. SYSU D00476]|uniref:hypothetical protein n=1 Tax=Telluribacter sp. SYSU D00476 TaxID=2811430 RepID=UPI001FF3778F|nr:hypothetical protein [Telluribacter sp. SYSU D00476]
MQLSLVDHLPEFDKRIFLDVFAKMTLDPRTRLPVLKTIEGQYVPCELKVRCDRKVITCFPEGTIYKLDARLVQHKGRKPYFTAIRSKSIQRALEFFEHNLQLQKGGGIPRKKVKPKAVFVPH